MNQTTINTNTNASSTEPTIKQALSGVLGTITVLFIALILFSSPAKAEMHGVDYSEYEITIEVAFANGVKARKVYYKTWMDSPTQSQKTIEIVRLYDHAHRTIKFGFNDGRPHLHPNRVNLISIVKIGEIAH